MAEAVKIQVEARDPAKNKGTGSRVARKLRASGRIPAIVYGHKQAPTPIALPREAVWEMIKKSTHIAELNLGGSTETVMVREVQWDYLGREIIHVDFARVDAGEQVLTEVRVDLKGQPSGDAAGGVIEQPLHAIKVRCKADSIPESIKVDISNLGLDQGIHVHELELPPGVTAEAEGELLVVHIVSRGTPAEPTGEGAAAPSPEVIKPERKETEE